MKKLLLLFLLIFTSIAFSQNDSKKITGTVVDSKGAPIPSVTVTFEDKNTTTDLDGKYSIEVKNAKSILRFSYLGFASQIVVVGKNKEINITLQESKSELDEVVVIGYGTQKRSNVTGSISKYKNEKLDEVAVSRLDQALQGKIAGVQVQNISSEAGADAQISVRGISSINAGASPLVVVDGQPIPDGLATLNMADVASVEVLKDAASAAIYGSRGASGVILITTKSGKTDKAKYSFKYSTGFKSAYEKYNMMTTSEYINLLYSERAIRLTDPAIQAEGLTNPNALNLLYQGSATKTNNLIAGYIVENTMLGGKGYDYQSEVLRNAEFKNIQFGATGGTKAMKYYISAGYQGDQGIMLKSNFQKLNFRTKFDIELSKRVKLNVNLNPSYTSKESPSENLTNFWRYPSWLPYQHNALTAAFVNQNAQWANIRPGDYAHPRHFIGLTYYPVYPDGSTLFMPDGTTFTPAAGAPSNSAQNNPMASLLSHDINAKSYGLQGGTTLNVNISPGFDFKTMNTVYVKYDTKFDWTDRNAEGDGIVNKGVYYDNSYVDLLTENTLNYKKELDESNSVELLLGYTAQQTRNTSTQTTGLDYPSNEFNTLNNALFIDKSGTFGSNNQIGLLSYLGRVNYVIDNKYFLTASYRTDGSSYFGPNKKWGSFPAASIGWAANKEPFLSNVDWLNKLNFRTSYGVSGNNRILNYGFQNLLSASNYSFGSGTGTQTGGQVGNTAINANEDITWESTFQTNYGMDLSILNNRINVTLDIYNSITDKLLLQQATMAFSGVPLSWNNIGSLRNRGFEVELNTTNLKGNFKWSTSANIAHTENRIIELGNEAYLLNYGERNEIYKSVVGGPLVQIFGYKTDGIWISQAQIAASGLTSNLPSALKQGGLKIVDINGDGVLDTNDRTIIGDPYPDFTWGITNNFSYKNFDLSFSLQGVQGGELINGDPNYGETKSANRNYNSNRWISPQNPGDGRTPYEELGFNWMLTDYVVEDASYFALREVNLGYNFPANLVKKIGLSSLRLYTSGQNLFFHSANGYRGINPEGRSTSGPYGSALIAGYQRGAFPIPKTYVFGIDINF